MKIFLSIVTKDLSETDIYDDNEALALKDFSSELTYLIVKKVQQKTPELRNQIVHLLINRIF
jgi:hypothetical protein